MIVLLRRVSCHEISFTTNISRRFYSCLVLLLLLLLPLSIDVIVITQSAHTHIYIYSINLCLEHHDRYMSRTRCHVSPQSCHLARKTESLACQNSHFNAINLNRNIYENCVCFYRCPCCCC